MKTHNRTDNCRNAFSPGTIVTLLLCTTFLATSLTAEPQSQRPIVIIVNDYEVSWSDCNLQKRMNDELTKQVSFTQVFVNGRKGNETASDDPPDLKQSLNFCKDNDVRFLLWCNVTHEEIRLVRSGSLPMLISRRRAVAFLDIDYRLVDCISGATLKSDSIALQERGPASIQLLEQTDADPMLCLTYSDKKLLFEKLEGIATAHLMELLANVSGNP